MKTRYEPELGQMAHGQPYKEYGVSALVEAALRAIGDEMARVYWNINQKSLDSPLDNMGLNTYDNGTFFMEGYDWGDNEQPYNFRWREIEISWYKRCGRGMSANADITPDMAAEMLTSCLESIRAGEPKRKK